MIAKSSVFDQQNYNFLVFGFYVHDVILGVHFSIFGESHRVLGLHAPKNLFFLYLKNIDKNPHVWTP